MYIRMTFRAVEVYELLEPLLNDYRKLRMLSMCTFIFTSYFQSWLLLVSSWIQLNIHGRVHRQTPSRRTGVRYYPPSSSQERDSGGNGGIGFTKECPHGRNGGQGKRLKPW